MNRKVRQSNFELLRIVAMLMIIGSHLACHGVEHCLSEADAYQIYSTGSLINRMMVSLLNPGGQIGVALFFMITGYFQINKKEPSILKVVLESVFYGLFAIALFVIVKLFFGGLSALETSAILTYVLKSLFIPATGGAWWFVSTYILLLLISPLLNVFLLKLNKKGFILAILVAWVLWYAIAYTAGAPFYDLQRGVFFYMIGGFCGLYYPKIDKNMKRFLCVVCAIIIWLMGAMIYYKLSMNSISPEPSLKIKMVSEILNTAFTAFIVPLCSISIFRFFESINMGSNKFINTVAGTTLGVYLIHDSFVGRHFIWYNLLKIDTFFYSKSLFPVYAFLITLGIFIVCSLIDLIRLKCIEPLVIHRAQRMINSIKAKYLKDI